MLLGQAGICTYFEIYGTRCQLVFEHKNTSYQNQDGYFNQYRKKSEYHQTFEENND